MTAPAPDEGLRWQIEARLRWHEHEWVSASEWPCPCDGVVRTPTEHRAHVADTILAVLAAVGPDSTGGQGESVTEWGVRGLSKGEPAVWTYRSRRDAEKSRATSEVLVSRTRYADTVSPWVPVEEADHG